MSSNTIKQQYMYSVPLYMGEYQRCKLHLHGKWDEDKRKQMIRKLMLQELAAKQQLQRCTLVRVV